MNVKTNIDQLLDVLLLVAVVDNLHVGQHVPEVPKTILIRFPIKKIGIKEVSHNKKNIDQLLDVLDLELIVDVHHGVHV